MKSPDTMYREIQPKTGQAAGEKAADRLYAKDHSRTAQVAAEKGIPVSFQQTKLPPITTDSFKLPGGVTVDRVRFGNFANILYQAQQRIADTPGEVVTEIRELGQRLLDLHLDEVRKAHIEFNRPAAEQWEKIRERWRQDFFNDPEIGKNRKGTTVTRAAALLETYGREVGDHRLSAFRDVMSQTGAGDHAEVLRFVDWAARKIAKKKS